MWLLEILKSLLIYWSKDVLAHTFPIIRFIFKKLLALPRFMKRNVKTEEEEDNFQNKLLQAQELYKNHSKSFNPSSINGYKKLGRLLSDKELIIYFIVRKTKPKTVVETGVAAGVSTGFILQALKENGSGKLYSIDLPFQWYTYGKNNELHLDSLPPGKMPGYIVPNKLKNKWKLILGDTYKELPKLMKRLNTIDLFLHDSEHTYKTMMFEYKTAWPFIKKGGYLLSDDVNFTDAFEKFSKRKGAGAVNLHNLGITKKH